VAIAQHRISADLSNTEAERTLELNHVLGWIELSNRAVLADYTGDILAIDNEVTAPLARVIMLSLPA
jgi:hypothetical protein